jgi:5-bromo-4-chloroindolyl phosphate hydrolysis protein
MSSGLGAVAGVVQAGAGLFGGGSTTQYVPNYSSMNEIIRGSVQQQELNYQAQSQLLNNSFMTQMGLQDAEYKQLLQQLEYDRANGQLDLQNQILQNEQALNMAEMNLAMQHLSDTYSLEAQRASANMEYTNAIQSFDNAAWLRSEASQVRESQFQADLAEGQAQIVDLRTSYERTQDQRWL